MLKESQIQDLLRIVSYNHIVFIGKNVGTDVLSDYDKNTLNHYGIDYKKLKNDEWTPIEKAFYFGKLSAALRDANSKKLTYNDFLKYMRRGQYEPLTEREKASLNYVKKHSYNYIKDLENSAIKDVNGIIITDQQKRRAEYEKVIKNAVKRAIVQKDSIKSVMSEIGQRTQDWQRNLARIAETEMQNAYEQGRLEQIIKEQGGDAQVYKDVFPGACRWCIKAYLTDGIGSQPKLFTPTELIANGTNIGIKPQEWKPVVGSMHPFCRCITQFVPKGMKWDTELKLFRYISDPTKKREYKTAIKYIIGDKTFYVK